MLEMTAAAAGLGACRTARRVRAASMGFYVHDVAYRKERATPDVGKRTLKETVPGAC